MFNGRQWVTDIATGAMNGVILGGVGHMLLPVPDVTQALWVGGILGLISGLAAEPLRWLFELRASPDDVSGPRSPSERDAPSPAIINGGTDDEQ